MVKEFQLHDFIEDYPSQNDDDIQWEIASRKEFFELASQKGKSQKKGRFFNHQEFLLRYARQYGRIFNIQATGTGKSGGIINLAEFYKKNNYGIKRIYVIQPGKSTKDAFKEQVKTLSDPGEYTNEKVLKAIQTEGGQKTVKNNINRLINEWYSVETYKVFAKENYSAEQIEEYYSDCVFFLDEVHWFRNSVGNEESSSKKEMEDVYKYFWKIFHTAKRTKVIIATATPMINSTQDFVPLINLLLPADKQLPDYINYDRVTLEQLEPYFRGLFSFIRFDNIYINPVSVGTSVENYIHHIQVASNAKGNSPPLQPVKKKIQNDRVITVSKPPLPETKTKTEKIPSFVKIVKLEMSDHQVKSYRKYSKSRKDFDYYSIQSSLFVFPDGSTGSEGEKIYLTQDDKKNMVFRDKIRVRTKGKIVEKESLYSFFDKNDIQKSLDSLKMMSTKFHFLVDNELQMSEKEKPGSGFCYIQYVSAAGAKLLGLFLKLFGFEELKNVGSIHNIKEDRIVGIKKKKRFAVLTAETPDIQSVINMFNSPDNMDGEYIQLIIGSSVVRDSVSLKNVVRGYIMTPTWHESGMYQAESRYKRAESHKDMSIREGKKIDVKTYRLAAVHPSFSETDYTKATIDIQSYLRAEEKNISNKRIFRFMKQTAIDAYLNYDKNVLPSDQDGSPESDYSTKYFKIWKSEEPPSGAPGLEKPTRKGIALNQGPNIHDVIYNTYNILYSQEVINKVKEELKNIFRTSEFINIIKFKQLMFDKKIISDDYTFYIAIQEMITNREKISDSKNIIDYELDINGEILYPRRFGFHQTGRISTEKDIYFDFPYKNLEEKEEITNDIYNDIKNFSSREEIVSYYVHTQNYKLFQSLLEDSLINRREGEENDINEMIISLLDNYIIETEIPVGYIEEARKALKSDNKSGQGRTRGEKSTAGLKYVDLEKQDPKFTVGSKVYVHFYRPSEKTGFGITSILEGKDRKIRILGEEGDFRDTDTAENFVYNYMFSQKYDILMKKYRESLYYGTYIMRGGETVKDITSRELNFFRVVDSSNPRNKGLVCKTGTEVYLKKVLKYIDKEKQFKQLYSEKIKRNKLCEILKMIFKQKDLLFVSM